jgi:cell division protein ZapA
MMRDIPIDIAGQEIKIRSDEDEDYVRSLAVFVDAKIKELREGQKGVTTLNLALTVALTIADELHKLQESGLDIDGTLNSLSTRIESAIASIDQVAD